MSKLPKNPVAVNGRKRPRERRDGKPNWEDLRNEIAALRREIRGLKDAVESPDTPRLLEVETCAEYLSVSERTLRSYLSDGTLPSVKIGRRRLVRATDLEGFVEDRLNS